MPHCSKFVFSPRRFAFFVTALLIVTCLSVPAFAQGKKRPAKPKPTQGASAEPSGDDAAQDKQARAAEKFNEAQELHAAGKLAEAVALYDQVVELDGEQFVVHFQRGLALLQLNRPTDAAGAFSRVVELRPDFAKGWAMLGEAEMRSNRPAEAEKAFLKALEFDAWSLSARVGAAQAMLARNAVKEAVALLDPLAKQIPEQPEFYAVYGEALRVQGNASEARRMFDEGLKRRPNDDVLLRGRAFASIALKDYAKAIDDLRAAYAQSPDPDTAADLTAAHQAAGRTADGIAFASEAVKSAPSHVRLRAGYAALLVEAEKTAEAAEQYTALTKLEPENALWWAKLGNMLAPSDEEKSFAAYHKALALQPKLVDAGIGLANGLLRTQKFEEAASRFQALVTENPNSYDALAGLATALFKLDRFQPAAQSFIRMLQVRPDVPITYFFLGICLDRLENYQQALKAYGMFLERADAVKNRLEIEKVQLRLPSLKRQAEQKGKRGDSK